MTLYWTQGRYDLIAIGEFPSEEIAMAAGLSSGRAGKLRSETLRAYTMEEMECILKRVT
ncbi:MAG: GYD domain-containing protein [Spirochaetia bacterium]